MLAKHVDTQDDLWDLFMKLQRRAEKRPVYIRQVRLLKIYVNSDKANHRQAPKRVLRLTLTAAANMREISARNNIMLLVS